MKAKNKNMKLTREQQIVLYNIKRIIYKIPMGFDCTTDLLYLCIVKTNKDKDVKKKIKKSL